MGKILIGTGRLRIERVWQVMAVSVIIIMVYAKKVNIFAQAPSVYTSNYNDIRHSSLVFSFGDVSIQSGVLSNWAFQLYFFVGQKITII